MKILPNVFSRKPTQFRDEVDEEMSRLQSSLESKRKIAIERLGNRWVLHPDNYMTKVVPQPEISILKGNHE